VARAVGSERAWDGATGSAGRAAGLGCARRAARGLGGSPARGGAEREQGGER
jgi:hypothetical protein